MSTFQSFEIDRDPHSSRKMMLIRPEPDPLHANLGKFGMCRNLAHQEGPSIEDKMRPPELDEDEGDGDEDRDGMYDMHVHQGLKVP